MQEDRSAGSQKCRKPEGRKPGAISRTVRISRMRENSSSVKIRPDVITFDMGILVFHFFVRLYIAILCPVEKKGGPGNRQKDDALFLDFPQSLISSHFLSLSRQPNTPLRMKTQGMLG